MLINVRANHLLSTPVPFHSTMRVVVVVAAMVFRVGVLDGDGYVQEMSTAADATMLFLDSIRLRSPAGAR